MAYYQTLKDTKKEKKRYTYGKEEGNRYNRKGNRESNRISVNDRPSSANGYPGERDMRPEYEKTRDERKPERKSRGTWREEERRMKSPSPAERPSHRDVTTGYRNYEYRTAEERNDTVSREEQAQYILTGRNPIREALKNHRDLEKLLVQKGELSGSAMEIVQKAKEQKVMIQVVDKTRLDEIAPRHQGLIAFASAYRYVTVEEILETAKEKGEPPFIVILDGVTDPHNLGAIIRTADCSGAHGVIVPLHRNVGLTPAAVKASAGAVEYVKVARVTNINRTIEELQSRNIWVYALSMEGTDYSKVAFEGGTALVIGAEGEGISRLTEEKCDMTLSLPMKGHLDSLNASVAAGIMMYHVMKERNKR